MQFTKGSIILVPTPVCLGILLAFIKNNIYASIAKCHYIRLGLTMYI